MRKKWEDLLKKLKSVKDLREAISVVKKSGMLNKEEESKVEIAKAHSKEFEEKFKNLTYLGRQKLGPNLLGHIIGYKDEDKPHYLVSVDLNRYAQKVPSITASLVGTDGKAHDSDAQQHSDLPTAIKAVMLHHGSKKWH
jgi:hypothetical protein